jgi:hypothetical protein
VQLSEQKAVTQQLVGQEAVTRQLSLTAFEDQLAELKSLAARLALHPGKPQRGKLEYDTCYTKRSETCFDSLRRGRVLKP